MLGSDVLKLVFAVSRTFVNILGDNFVVFGISSIAFWVIGWVIMFGGWKWPLGLTSWLVTSDDNSPVIDAYKQVYGSITNIPVFF